MQMSSSINSPTLQMHLLKKYECPLLALNHTKNPILQARSILEQHDWNFETAVQLWYASLEADASDDDNDDMEEESSNPQPIPSSSRPPQTTTSGAASSSKQSKQGGGIRTLQDLGSQSHDHDEDDENSDNDYFAGGEKSGLAVHGGSGNRDPQDHIQSLLDRARR
jgi:UBX domain-containing protein 1